MKPSDPEFGGPHFQISKGKQENGETALDAAIREGAEELGLRVLNISRIHPLGTFLGRTEVFMASIVDPQDFGPPDYETSETKWMTPDEFRTSGRPLHKQIVRAAVDMLRLVGEMPHV